MGESQQKVAVIWLPIGTKPREETVLSQNRTGCHVRG
jgi:hypothetical protein